MSVLKIKDQNGQWTDVLSIKGEKGDNGQDYVLTENDKQEIAGLVDTPVDDVQINGTSIVNDGVANIPFIGYSQHGIAKLSANTNTGGLSTDATGVIYIDHATSALIKTGTNRFRPVAPDLQHESVFYGLAKASGDTTQSQSDNAVGTYTDEAKASIKTMIGVEDPVIDDVQVNGASIVTDGVANIPIANASGTVPVGLVKPASATGTAVASNGGLAIVQSNLSAIKTGANQYNPIVPQHQHESVFYGLAKVAGHDERESVLNVGAYSDEAKSAIQGMLGVPSEDDVVSDVQVNGTSVVENGVANISLGNNSQFGVVKGNTAYGINIANGEVRISSADSNLVKVGSTVSKPLTPNTQHEATFYGLAKAAGSDEKDSTLPVGTYTDSAKTAIKQMLGVKDDYDSLVVEVSGTDPVITGKPSYRYNCGELYTLSITPPESGTMDIIFTSGATPTILTLPNTVKMPTWWAGIETNTTYEMCITDGVYCGVMSWAI